MVYFFSLATFILRGFRFFFCDGVVPRRPPPPILPSSKSFFFFFFLLCKLLAPSSSSSSSSTNSLYHRTHTHTKQLASSSSSSSSSRVTCFVCSRAAAVASSSSLFPFSSVLSVFHTRTYMRTMHVSTYDRVFLRTPGRSGRPGHTTYIAGQSNWQDSRESVRTFTRNISPASSGLCQTYVIRIRKHGQTYDQGAIYRFVVM